MSSYDFDVEHIPGKNNIVADGLSRFCTMDPTEQEVTKEYINILIEESVRGVPRIPHQAYEKICLVHNDSVGHNGVNVTLDRLSRKDKKWEHMRRDVTNFIRRCPLCQKVSQRKNEVYTSPFTTSGYSPFQRVAIDSIGPLPADDDGNRHILVIIDAFSRFCHLVPIKDLEATTAADAIIKFIGLFGIPSEIVSDNGTQFINKTVEHLLKSIYTEHTRINPYSHEENGLVERANKEILRYLRAIVNERKIKRKWINALPFVQRITNAQVHSVLGVSPAQIIFGNTIDLDRVIINPLQETPDVPWDNYVQEHVQLQHEIIQAATNAQFESDQYNIAQRTPEQALSEFPINSYVLAKYEGDQHRPRTKLHTYWRGPLRVVASDDATCTVQNLVTNKLESLHKKLLKPFIYDSQITDPADIAAQDEDYYKLLEV